MIVAGKSPERAASRHRGRSVKEKTETVSSSPAPSDSYVDRGRSRVRRPSNPFSEENLRRKGYHSLMSSFGKVFHVEKRWTIRRELGSGAYGHVISAADDISGEIVAIKLVTRVFDKIQLAKRALREITLLRHFASHENITGLIDVDAVDQDFNEIYIFMEPMEADLHQIIKSGQSLTNEHVQYFLYQILRGMKYVHSASVIHRDLKPGNLLVNADCELKICDFGLSRGFESRPDENPTHLTEYVATRWYRAPEIMLAFRRYTTAIDVWSVGCILAELLMGKPLFKGKDYVDQLNKVLDVLGTPDENVIKRIGSEKAQAYVRSLPIKKTVSFSKVIPSADPLAIDLLKKMLTFDPSARLTVLQALEHPWLASYHDVDDEPSCPETFEKWREIEELETIDDFREALWNEIEDYRREVRGVHVEFSGLTASKLGISKSKGEVVPAAAEPEVLAEKLESVATTDTVVASPEILPDENKSTLAPPPPPPTSALPPTPTDPVVTYARRSSIMQPSRQGSTYNTPLPSNAPTSSFADGLVHAEPSSIPTGGVVFPTQGYVLPARSRTASTTGGEVTRRLLRTLSTVSIHETAENVPNGLAGIAPMARYSTADAITGADAPPSEMPTDFGIEEEEDQGHDSNSASKKKHDGSGKFHFG